MATEYVALYRSLLARPDIGIVFSSVLSCCDKEFLTMDDDMTELRSDGKCAQKASGLLRGRLFLHFHGEGFGPMFASCACFCSRLNTVSKPTPAEIATRIADAN
jgi:hypothetical protein